MQELKFQLMVSKPESGLLNAVLPFQVSNERLWYSCFEKVTDNLKNNIEDTGEENGRQKSISMQKKWIYSIFLVQEMKWPLITYQI